MMLTHKTIRRSFQASLLLVLLIGSVRAAQDVEVMEVFQSALRRVKKAEGKIWEPCPTCENGAEAPVNNCAECRGTGRKHHDVCMSISLQWGTKDDLDLIVTTSNGDVIDYKSGFCKNSSDAVYTGPTECGATLDVDANAHPGNATSEPVENIVWQKLPPKGEYIIEVLTYRPSPENTPNREIPFTLIINDQLVRNKTIQASKFKSIKYILNVSNDEKRVTSTKVSLKTDIVRRLDSLQRSSGSNEDNEVTCITRPSARSTRYFAHAQTVQFKYMGGSIWHLAEIDHYDTNGFYIVNELDEYGAIKVDKECNPLHQKRAKFCNIREFDENDFKTSEENSTPEHSSRAEDAEQKRETRELFPEAFDVTPPTPYSANGKSYYRSFNSTQVFTRKTIEKDGTPKWFQVKFKNVFTGKHASMYTVTGGCPWYESENMIMYWSKQHDQWRICNRAFALWYRSDPQPTEVRRYDGTGMPRYIGDEIFIPADIPSKYDEDHKLTIEPKTL